MTQVSLAKIIADFETSLATKIDVGGTTATLQAYTDDDGVALPTGRYFFTIDGNNSSKEHIAATLGASGALTAIKTVSRQGTETSGVVRGHRVGAKVVITDFAHIKKINDLLDGTTNFDPSVVLAYSGTASISSAHQFATKDYVDGVTQAGASDASVTVKGIARLSTGPVSATGPIVVGDNDPRLPTSAQVGYIPTSGQKDALVGDNTDIAVGTGNKFVTQTGLQHSAENYAADAGSNDTYVVTLSPAPTSYTNGMVIRFKANTANTGAATLNVNSLGAITIVKNGTSTLADSDIKAGQIVEVIYNSTGPVFELVSGVNATYAFGNASDLATATISTFDETITTGFTPRLIKLHYFLQGHDRASDTNSYYGIKGIAIFNGTTLVSNTSIFGTLDGKGSVLTGDDGNFGTTFTGYNDVNGTPTLSAGIAVAGSTSDILITLTINSVSSTGFVIRKVTSKGGTFPSTARCKIYYEAFA